MNKINAWNNIPLEDYERHMQHKDVGQIQLLNSLTKKYIQKYNPENFLFLGISGGNGLEHIDTRNIEKVCCIDINKSYLEETRKRFGEKIQQLELINVDIETSDQSFLKADFIWAALILEYVDIEKCFKFIKNNAYESAKLIITIQSNNGNKSVSQTGIESLNFIEDIFKIVDKENLQNTAFKYGFKLINSEENGLPNGKSFFTYEFER